MKINFGVIGTNVITERFLEAGKDAEGFCLRGVYSRSREKPLILPENMEQILPLTVWKTWIPVRR